MTKRNENRQGYKKTKCGWIPKDWEYVSCKNIARLTAGGTPSTKHKEYWNGRISWMSSGELNLKRVHNVVGRITEEGLNNSAAKLIPAKTVLIGLAGQGKTRGTVAINEIELCTNQSVAAIIPDKSIAFYLYIFYNLENRYFELRRLSTGDGGRGGLNLHLLGILKLPLPPLPEQKKIAKILSAWDKAIEQTKKLINTKKRLKKGLMQQLLTGRMRFKKFGKPVKEKGEVPEGWELKSLGSIGTFLKGKNISNCEKIAEGLPCITYGEIYTKHEIIFKDFYSYIDLKTAKKSQQIKKCDILFAGSGETIDEIGKCVTYIRTIEAYAGGDIIIFSPYNANSIFLSYLINSDFIVKQRRKLGQGHSVVHIYSSGLKSLHIPLPLITEQEKIAEVLIKSDQEIELLQKKESALQQQKKGLMQKLLTGEVRVKIR